MNIPNSKYIMILSHPPSHPRVTRPSKKTGRRRQNQERKKKKTPRGWWNSGSSAAVQLVRDAFLPSRYSFFCLCFCFSFSFLIETRLKTNERAAATDRRSVGSRPRRDETRRDAPQPPPPPEEENVRRRSEVWTKKGIQHGGTAQRGTRRTFIILSCSPSSQKPHTA